MQTIPTLGRIVLYESKNGDGIKSPAIVLRTRATTDPNLIERWGGDKGALSGASKPEGLVAELPDDYTVDLLVHGLGGDYREYCVGMFNPEAGGNTDSARTWSWPAY